MLPQPIPELDDTQRPALQTRPLLQVSFRTVDPSHHCRVVVLEQMPLEGTLPQPLPEVLGAVHCAVPFWKTQVLPVSQLCVRVMALSHHSRVVVSRQRPDAGTLPQPVVAGGAVVVAHSATPPETRQV